MPDRSGPRKPSGSFQDDFESHLRPREALSAAPQNAPVKVKVGGVCRVVIGSKRDPEIAAGSALYSAQKLRFGPSALPMMQHGYLPAVPEREARDINRIRRGVFTAPVLALDVAAAVSPQVMDFCDRVAEYGDRCGLKFVPSPQ